MHKMKSIDFPFPTPATNKVHSLRSFFDFDFDAYGSLIPFLQFQQ
jgi:hypothetical protein